MFVEFKEQEKDDLKKSSKHRYRHKRSRSRSGSPRREYEDRFSRRVKPKREIELNFSLFDKPGAKSAAFPLMSFKEKANVLLTSKASEFCQPRTEGLKTT